MQLQRQDTPMRHHRDCTLYSTRDVQNVVYFVHDSRKAAAKRTTIEEFTYFYVNKIIKQNSNTLGMQKNYKPKKIHV